MLAHEGVHHLHRAAIWSEALSSRLKEEAAGVSYDEYLEAGCDPRNAELAEQREMIRRDIPHVFPSHPRFVRSYPPSRTSSWDLARHSGASCSSSSLNSPGRGSPTQRSRRSLHFDGGEGGAARGAMPACAADGTPLRLQTTSTRSGSSASLSQDSDSCSETGSRRGGEKVEYCVLDALERVLLAAAARSPQGYCSAMCTVAGVLLLEADDEENAFWMLVAFVEDLAPWMFTRSAMSLNAEAAAIDFAVEEEFPALHAKLRAASVRPSLLVAGWITRLGVTVLPGEGVLRLWDAVILEGIDVLPQSILAFLRSHGNALAAIPTGGGEGGGGDGGGASSGGAALLDAVDELAAGQFRMDEVVSAAVESAREAREDHSWLRMRSAARAAVATRASGLGSLRGLIDALRERAADSTTTATTKAAAGEVTRVEFEEMVAAAYPSEKELGNAAAAAAVRAAFEKARERRRSSASVWVSGVAGVVAPELEDESLGGGVGVTYEDFLRACVEHPTLAAQLRLIELEGASAELRMRRLLRGDDNNINNQNGEDADVDNDEAATAAAAAAADREFSTSAPSPSSLAVAVRTSHTAMGVGITSASAVAVAAPRSLTRSPSSSSSAVSAAFAAARNSAAAAAAAASNAAALESAMLFGRGGERWLESVRLSSRGALVLAALSSAVYAASPTKDTFEVSVVRTNDVVPSMGSLLVWPPRIPHTQYNLLVQRPGCAPYVLVKRYNDFRNLHARAEQRGLCLTVGPSLELPNTGRQNFAAFSSDPDVVALRAVGLQRYVDLLASSGCPRANAQLRSFLELVDDDDVSVANVGSDVSSVSSSAASSRDGGAKKKKKMKKKGTRDGGCGLGVAAGIDCSDFLPSLLF